jgi:hypothetical protein
MATVGFFGPVVIKEIVPHEASHRSHARTKNCP